MTQVVLKGTPACAWQIDGKDKNGGTVLDLTDKELDLAKKNKLIEYYVDKEKQDVKEEKPKKKILTKEQIDKKGRKWQFDFLKKAGIKPARLEKNRINQILKVQK